MYVGGRGGGGAETWASRQSNTVPVLLALGVNHYIPDKYCSMQFVTCP